MHIIFPYYQTECDLPAGTTVHEACRMIGHPLNTACGGTGVCGKCLAVIRHNGLTAQVLACQQTILPEMAILISPDHREEKLLTESSSMTAFQIDPLLHTYPVAVASLIEESENRHQTIFETLQSWLPVALAPLSCDIRRTLHQAAIDRPPLINLMTIHNYGTSFETIIDIETNDHVSEMIGLAFDIGTTSVAAYLLDFDEGWRIDSEAALNKQTAFGADVLGRVSAVKNQPARLAELSQALWSTLAQLTKELCDRNQIRPEKIHAVTYCGNTIMTHFLLGHDPVHLGEAPFLQTDKDTVMWIGAQLPGRSAADNDFKLPVSDRCLQVILPGMNGLIGSDTTAVLTTLPSDGKIRLMIDLGTNCEIAVGSDENYTVTSAACGPAFEGAGITMGSRSAAGAISACTLDNDHLSFEIIGEKGTKAEGLCGSGLIDCIAVLLEIGAILPDGSFAENLTDVQQSFTARFDQTANGERIFKFMLPEENSGKTIVLTQKDVRALQLAIGAIRTAWQLLLRETGTKTEDLEAIVLSGAFGSAIDLKNAKKIGLLPDFENVPVYSAGNGAGAGVQQVLLSRDALKKAENISKNGRTLNLAEFEDFNTIFMQNLNFKI